MGPENCPEKNYQISLSPYDTTICGVRMTKWPMIFHMKFTAGFAFQTF